MPRSCFWVGYRCSRFSNRRLVALRSDLGRVRSGRRTYQRVEAGSSGVPLQGGESVERRGRGRRAVRGVHGRGRGCRLICLVRLGKAEEGGETGRRSCRRVAHHVVLRQDAGHTRRDVRHSHFTC